MNAYAVVVVVHADSAEGARDAVVTGERSGTGVLAYVSEPREVPQGDEYACNPPGGHRVAPGTVEIA